MWSCSVKRGAGSQPGLPSPPRRDTVELGFCGKTNVYTSFAFGPVPELCPQHFSLFQLASRVKTDPQ